MQQKDAILHVHHFQKCKLHELQHLQALLMLCIHLWWCVTPRKVLHDIFLHVTTRILLAFSGSEQMVSANTLSRLTCLCQLLLGKYVIVPLPYPLDGHGSSKEPICNSKDGENNNKYDSESKTSFH